MVDIEEPKLETYDQRHWWESHWFTDDFTGYRLEMLHLSVLTDETFWIEGETSSRTQEKKSSCLDLNLREFPGD